MTSDEIVTLVLNRCGKRSSDTELTAAAFLELARIQTDYEEGPELPWFLISEASSANLTSGDPRISVPSDFLMEVEEGALWIQNSEGNWKELHKEEYDQLRAVYQNETAGLPKYYALRGKYFYFGPIPDANYSVRMVYYQQQTAAAAGVTNQWTTYASDLLIGTLGDVIAGEYLNDFQKQKVFQNRMALAYKRMLDKDVARAEMNMRGQM